MTKLLISLLGAGVLATGGWAAASGLDDSQPARTVSLPGATNTDETTTGTTTAATPAATTTGTTIGTTTVEDISGPCDEAEHANDPRCAGGATTGDDDRSGSGRGSGDDHDDDRSGSNSGKG
jgi:hypothetical protein